MPDDCLCPLHRHAGPDPDSRNRQSDTAVIPLQIGSRSFGCLQLGKRCSGRKYMSQDLAFLDKVAGKPGTLTDFKWWRAST